MPVLHQPWPRARRGRTSAPSLAPALTPLLALAVASTFLLSGCAEDDPASSRPSRTPSTSADPGSPSATPSTTPSATPSASAGPTRVDSTVAEGLDVPWGLALLPDGDVLVSERDSGRLLVLTLSENGEPAAPDSEWRVREVGRINSGTGVEGGVLGVATRPVDASKPAGPVEVFVHVTTARDNRVLRGTFSGTTVDDLEPVLTGIPRSDYHDGGRIALGPDGHLWITTGDAGEPDLAQDRTSLAGKILRVTTDGEPAPDNPFPGSPVWSYGHRNVQGIAWDDSGQLWATEFGQNTLDELNRVEKGGNHGWPLAEGDDGPQQAPDGTPLVAPAHTWAPEDASPSGLAHVGGRLWMAGLRGERLWEISTDADGPEPRAWFTGDHGRLRSVLPGPDGGLWVTTSNTDGRGDPTAGDDRILRVAIAPSD